MTIDHVRGRLLVLPLLLVLLALWGCSRTEEPAPAEPPEPSGAVSAAEIERNSARNAYFGDLHVHTRLSFDAFIFGTRSTPDSAYAYALGEPIDHPAGFQMQLDRPLDFLGVTDHAMYMGMLEEMSNPETRAGQHPIAVGIREAETPASRLEAFQAMFPYLRKQLDGPDDLLDPAVLRSAWQETVAAAERRNDPGRFTSFVAYEYTAGGAERQNLHRNVVFRGAAPELPFSSMDSGNPEDLWAWMDAQRGQGVEALAIPHNSNGSDGLMFELTRVDGSPMDAAYAEQRMRNEPLVEITQVKGTSDAHPLLSPNDEWADFELMEVKVATVEPSRAAGSYVREAYLNGLAMQAEQGFNPYRFGLIGSSDTHVGAGSFDEANYWSKVGIVDATSVQRGSVPMDEPDADGNLYVGGDVATFQDWGASGLAGVWAEANTREDIYDAFRRKETFATTGPRMQVRFFAGFGLEAAEQAGPDRISALYRDGVPMGGDLVGGDTDTAPHFFLWALSDPASARLQRLQVIKGWIDAEGRSQEKVFDVACSDGLEVDEATHRCPDNGARVNLTDCSISQNVGAAELESLWKDPEFDAGQMAFYYVRALENPTCRWSTWDAVRAGVEPRADLQATIQERVWSSPIWYVPGGLAGDQPEAEPAAASLVGTRWLWVGSTIGSADVEVAEPHRYTLLLNADGGAEVRLDCNQGRGSYQLEGGALRLGPIMSTRMACPEDSKDFEFGQQLDGVTGFSMDGGALELRLNSEGDVMRFRAETD